jgi:serine/threonine protein kinase/tetratricopeptide (TPR) repeat protein
MPSSHDSHDYDLLDRLAEEFADRFRRGERPTVQEYIDRYPGLADDLRELLPAMVEMEQAKEEPRDEPPAAAPPIRQLGDYRILREVGHGGMGVVYEAEQLSLGRRVALKILPGALLRDARQKRRFEREARAAAKLHHTNIVPVFGVGEHDGQPYYAMQFIQGLGLDEVIEELARMKGPGQGAPAGTPPGGEVRIARAGAAAQEVARSLLTGEFRPAPEEPTPEGDTVFEEPSPLARALSPSSSSGSSASSSAVLPGQSGVRSRKPTYWHSVATIGVQVAGALDHAHKQGIQHRDIKPSNLLLDTRGTVWVTDFGLAKVTGPGAAGDNLTHTGDLLGTLRYMPPEAFDGKVDIRGDIYALGLTLYELLALRPAFDEKDRPRLIKQVTGSEPPRLHRLNPTIPRDLVTIVHKAMDRDPAQRYSSAEALQADLEHFLNDEPIRARRTSAVERLARWSRRNKSLAAALSAVALLLVVLTGAALLFAANEAREAREKTELAAAREAERVRAVEAKNDAEKAKRLALDNLVKAREAVDQYLTAVSEEDLLKAPGMQALRQRMLQAALRFYDGFLKEHGDDPKFQAGLAAAHLRVGRIHSDLGQHQASRYHTEALRRFRELDAALPANADPAFVQEVRHGLADCHFRLGQNDEAIALWTRLVQPGQTRFQAELANAYNSLAISAGDNNDLAGALEAQRKALAIRETLVLLEPDNAEHRRDLGGTLNNIGVLLAKNRRHDEALVMYRRAQEHARAAYDRQPHSLLTGRFLATSLNNLASIERSRGHDDEALRWYRAQVEVLRQLAFDNPAVPYVHAGLYQTSVALGRYESQLGHKDAAEKSLFLARTALQRLPQEGAENLFRLACIHALGARDDASLDKAERAERRQEADRALEALNKAVAAGFRRIEDLRTNADLAAVRDRPELHKLVADLDRALKVEDTRKVELEKLRSAVRAAEQQAQSALSTEQKVQANEQLRGLRERLAELDPSTPDLRADRAASLAAIGLVQLDLGRHDEAAQSLKEALALRQALIQETPNSLQYRLDLGSSHLAFASLYWKTGQQARAARAADQGLADLGVALKQSPDSPAVLGPWAGAELAVGAAYLALGLYDEAGEHYARVFDRAPPGDAGEWRTHTLLRLLAGDQAGYRRGCQEMARRFTGEPASWPAHYFLAASIAGGGADDPQRVLEIARAFQRGNPREGWRGTYVGFACYRAGRWEEALALMEGSHWAMTYSVRALINQELGKKEEARRWLAEADAAYEREVQESLADPARVFLKGAASNLHDRMQFLALRREAHRVIEGQDGDRDTLLALYRDFQRARLATDPGPDTAAPGQAVPDAQVEVRKALEALLATQSRRLANQPDSLPHRLDLVSTHLVLAEVHWKAGRLPDLGRQLGQARELLEAIPAEASAENALRDRAAGLCLSVGRWYANLALWQEASQAFARAFALAPPAASLDWHSQALLLLVQGQPEGYAEHVRRMRERFRNDSRATVELVRVGTLAPASGFPPDELVKLAADLYAQDRQRGWNQALYRLALFRTRPAQEALEALPPKTAVGAEMSVLALLHHRLGHAEEATRWLRGADQTLSRSARETFEHGGWRGKTSNRFWEDLLHEWLFYREAHQEMHGAAPPANPWVLLLRARSYARFGETDRALAELEAVTATAPADPGVWLARAQAYGELGQKDRAEADVKKAAETQPTDLQGWRGRGRVFAELGRFDEAAADYVKTLELLPPPDANDWSADKAGIYGEVSTRDELYCRVAERRPRDYVVRFHRLNHLGRQGRWREAATAAGPLLELVSASSMVRYYAAPLFLETGDAEAYRRNCQEMLKLFAGTTSAGVAQQTTLTCLLTPEGIAAPEVLERLAETALRSDGPGWVRGWDQLTRALAEVRAGEHATAEGRLRKLVSSQPEGSSLGTTALTVLALAQQKKGQAAEARKTLAAARTRLEKRRQPNGPGFVAEGVDWQNWLRCQVLLREVEALGKSKKPG